MKRIVATIFVLCMILCAGCAAAPAETTDANELRMGAYSGSATYAKDGFSMTWVFTINFDEDGSFVLTNDAGEEKGAGTWASSDDGYTMTYSDDRTAAFVFREDGTLEVISDLPFGKNGISPDMVGGIVLSYVGEASDAVSGATA